jgi:hypothetical protein
VDAAWNLRQFTFKLRVTDPFAFTLVNAILNPDD